MFDTRAARRRATPHHYLGAPARFAAWLLALALLRAWPRLGNWRGDKLFRYWVAQLSDLGGGARVALALVPQLVGHTGINYAAKHLDTTLVASALLLEPIGAGLLALLLFREQPAPLTVVGAAVLLVGVAVTSRAQAQRRPQAPEARAAGR